jgi:hypothetical protein
MNMGDINSQIAGRNPNPTDYLAGAMLANGIIWIWNQALGNITFFSQFSKGIQADLTYVIWLLAAIVSSMQVCKRASYGHLLVGLKFAGLAWVLSLIIMLSIAADPSFTLAFSMLMIFIAGGIAGAYFTAKSRATLFKPSRL